MPLTPLTRATYLRGRFGHTSTIPIRGGADLVWCQNTLAIMRDLLKLHRFFVPARSYYTFPIFPWVPLLEES